MLRGIKVYFLIVFLIGASTVYAADEEANQAPTSSIPAQNTPQSQNTQPQSNQSQSNSTPQIQQPTTQNTQPQQASNQNLPSSPQTSISSSTPTNSKTQNAPMYAPNPPSDTPMVSKPAPIIDHLDSPDSAEGILTAGIKAAKNGDYKTAFKLFSQSCDEGNPAGCFAVGTMYMNGVGIQTNIQKASRYYQMGCSGGDATACANLAMIYDYQKNSDLQDKEKAAQLYMTGCQGGDVLACNNLAWMYANGEGVPKDFFKATEYYKLACQAGSDMACYNLGLMSNTNNIYGPDKAKLGLVDLNYLACKAGDIVGCGNLGWMYANGTSGAPVSYFYAAKYFQIACDGGMLGSCNNLGVLYQKGYGVPQDSARALDLFAYVCDNGLESGCDNYRIFKQQLLNPRPKSNRGSFFLPSSGENQSLRR